MRTFTRILILLTSSLLCALSYAQVLENAENESGKPAYKDLRPRPTPELDKTIEQMHKLVRELQQGDLSPVQKQAALDELIRDRETILRQHSTWLDWQQPQTVDSAALLLEKMLFEQAAEIAPTPQSREQVLREAPQQLELDPGQSTPDHYVPPLVDPVADQDQAIISPLRPVDAQVTDTSIADEESDSTSLPSANSGPEHKKSQKISVGKNVKVSVFADNKTTTDMHSDSTVVRDVVDQDGELVLFNQIHLWVGGALQLDAYTGDGLFTLAEGGGSDSKSYIRRGEVIIRASVLKNSEIKAQYDLDTRQFRDLYWRWLSKSNARSLTIGNQKEPIGQDYQVGNKFTSAMEPSAPSSAFGSYRSTGIRYHGWATVSSEDQPIQAWGDSRTHVTTSLGLFGQDIESSNETDWSITGRLSIGGRQTEEQSFHLAVATSYRHGEFDRIAPRPGLHDVNRIHLAYPYAETQTLAALEAIIARGSLHSQMELYYSDYGGGEVDAQGWGGYGQIGWLFAGQQRVYHPKWGIWGPILANNRQVFEVFGRISYTRGDDDINSANEMALLTIGGNWYYQKYRISTNLIVADTRRDISGESQGNAIAARLQYLF